MVKRLGEVEFHHIRFGGKWVCLDDLRQRREAERRCREVGSECGAVEDKAGLGG